MTEARPDYATRFRLKGDKPLSKKPISVALPIDEDAVIRKMLPGGGDRSEYLRRIICEALQRDFPGEFGN